MVGAGLVVIAVSVLCLTRLSASETPRRIASDAEICLTVNVWILGPSGSAGRDVLPPHTYGEVS
jgi:hypothetical protein